MLFDSHLAGLVFAGRVPPVVYLNLVINVFFGVLLTGSYSGEEARRLVGVKP